MIRKTNVNGKTFIWYAWHLLEAICLEKWITDPLIKEMRETDTQTNELSWSSWSSYWVTVKATIHISRLYVDHVIIGFGFLSLMFLYFCTLDPISHDPSDWKVQKK